MIQRAFLNSCDDSLQIHSSDRRFDQKQLHFPVIKGHAHIFKNRKSGYIGRIADSSENVIILQNELIRLDAQTPAVAHILIQ